MPPILTPQKLGQVVLDSVEHGAYPDSERVASAQLPHDALPTLLAGIERAQNEVKAEIRSLSRDAAPDIDGWIAQAKQLQADIERSRATAHDIVQQAEAGKSLHSHVQDASSKVSLLKNELAFNDTLTATVERIKQASDLLDIAQDAAAKHSIIEALENLKRADDYIIHLGPFRDTRVAGVLHKRANQLREVLAENALGAWSLLLVVDTAENRVTINKEVNNFTLETVEVVLSRLGTLDTALQKFQRGLEQTIVNPRLVVKSVPNTTKLNIADQTIEIVRGATAVDVVATLEDIRHLCDYLSTRLPQSISKPLSEKLIPDIVSRLNSDWLASSIPISLDGLGPYQKVLSSVSEIADYIGGLDWPCQGLREWVEKAPDNYVACRRENALASVRELCSQGVQQKREVERVETQMVSHDDAIMAGETAEEAEDDWAAWDNDDEEKASQSATTKNEKQGKAEVEEEDLDVDAWGIGDDAEDNTAKATSEEDPKGNPEEEDTDAWGWGDDDEPGDVENTERRSDAAKEPPKKTKRANGEAQKGAPQERELTLREKYTVTVIPDAIMEIITQIVSDAQALTQPKFAGSPIAPAGPRLYSIPNLVLAMYRATAPVFYANDIAGNMLAYNDSTRLVDELQNFLIKQVEIDEYSDIPLSSRPSKLLRLEPTLKAIESFSKRAYGKEMESQRTILRDLLDGAQGFDNCTTAPFAAECDNAVSMTVDRIREVAKQWTGILSHSVLLQSLGSLLATVLNKMIVDIEDMSDISEEESKRLRDFCTRISTLSELFTQPQQQGDMTGIYTPNWFKFQYLGEILESSLADIKYLWTEGELKLEFEADEVVELINALFADSDYRRKAVADIKRTAR